MLSFNSRSIFSEGFFVHRTAIRRSQKLSLFVKLVKVLPKYPQPFKNICSQRKEFVNSQIDVDLKDRFCSIGANPVILVENQKEIFFCKCRPFHTSMILSFFSETEPDTSFKLPLKETIRMNCQICFHLHIRNTLPGLKINLANVENKTQLKIYSFNVSC